MTNTMNAQQAGFTIAQQKHDTWCSAGLDQQMYLSKADFELENYSVDSIFHGMSALMGIQMKVSIAKTKGR